MLAGTHDQEVQAQLNPGAQMVGAGICFQIWLNSQATSVSAVVPSDALEYGPSRPQAFILPVKREPFSPGVSTTTWDKCSWALIDPDWVT